MKKIFWISVLFASLLALPALAGVAGEGDGVLNKTTVNNTVNLTETTFITEQVLVEHLAQICGVGTVTGVANRTFYREALVSAPEASAAIAEVTRLLTNDVLSVGGRTNQFSSGSRFLGSSTSVIGSTTETTHDGQTTVTETDVDVVAAPGTIFVGDPDNDPCNVLVLFGQLDITITNTTTITDFLTQLTTEQLRQVDAYLVSVCRVVSPLVLDMNGTGKIEASRGEWLPHRKVYPERMAFFDLNANGFPVCTEWVGPNDGLLCRPKSDGSVDGSCLFGTSTGFSDGFEALSVLDADGDRSVSGAELAGLMVWQDKNGNAIADAGELKSVSEAGITNLKLSHKKFVSSFTINGETRRMYDWWPNVLELNKVNLKDLMANR